MGVKFDIQPQAALSTVTAADSHGQTMEQKATSAVNAADLLATEALSHAGGVAAAVRSFSSEVLEQTQTSLGTARNNNAEGTRAALGLHEAGDAEVAATAQSAAGQTATPDMPGGSR